MLVESTEDVDRLKFDDPRRARLAGGDKLAYLTQTTLSVDDANRIIARLKERFPHIVGPPKEDICYATQNRQEAVRELLARGRRRAGAGKPEQLEQPAAGRTGPRDRRERLFDRRSGRHRSGLVRPHPIRCWSPPAPARRNRSWKNASISS